MLGLTPRRDADEPIDVTVPVGSAHARAGIRLHRRATLQADEVTVLGGIRVTSAARTVLDLAGMEAPAEVERVIAEALVQRMTDPREWSRLLERHANHRGVGHLRALLDEGGEAGLVRSEAEKEFKALIEWAGLPKPQANRHVAGRRRDFVWPGERVVVEVDGHPAHGPLALRERPQPGRGAVRRGIRLRSDHLDANQGRAGKGDRDRRAGVGARRAWVASRPPAAA